MAAMTKTEALAAVLSGMFSARGLPALSEDESVALCDAFMDAVNAEVDEREKTARAGDDW